WPGWYQGARSSHPVSLAAREVGAHGLFHRRLVAEERSDLRTVAGDRFDLPIEEVRGERHNRTLVSAQLGDAFRQRTRLARHVREVLVEQQPRERRARAQRD